MAVTLITGATGFIGCRLAESRAAAGREVRAVGLVRNDIESQRADALLAAGVDMQVLDLKSSAEIDRALENVDVVIHLAAAQHEANVSESYFHETNVSATRGLVERCGARGVAKLFYASSIGVYGVNDDTVIDENTPVAPDNHYGRSKAAAEEVLHSYEGSVEVFIGRIGETYGPWDMRLHKLYAGMRKGRFWLVGPCRNRHQPVHVDDLAVMIERLLETPEAIGKPVLMTGDRAITTEEMCRSIASSLDRRLPGLRIPMWPLLAAAVGMEMTLGRVGIQPPLHRRRLDFFRKSLTFSTELRDRLLDLPPQRSFDEGARETAEWYRQHGWLPAESSQAKEISRNSIMVPAANRFVETFEVDESLTSDRLSAKLEPFDSFWQAPDDIESGYPKFDAYYRANYLPLMPADKSVNILVMSCGPGYFVKVLAEAGYKNVLGIDSFPEKVEHAARKGLNCRVERGFEHLAEHPDTYDVIVAEQELNHLTLDESLSFLTLCRKSLKKGGLLHVYAMNSAHPLYGAENLAHNIDHFYTVTEFSLGQIMKAGGFDEVRLHPLKLYVFWKNPMNYVGLAITGTLDLIVRILFKLYAKNVKILTKKIAATGRNPGAA